MKQKANSFTDELRMKVKNKYDLGIECIIQ